jgi:Tfp pilus assembly protein PilN
MIQINLLSGRGMDPDKPTKEKKVVDKSSSSEMDMWQLIAAAIFIVGAIGIGVWGWWLYSKKADLTRTLNQKRQELKNYEGLIEKEKKLLKQKELLEKKENTIIALKDNQTGPYRILEEIFNRLPEEVWFESLSQKGKHIVIKGRAKNTEAANRFYQFLSKSKMVSGIQYPLLKKDEKYKIRNVVYFEISFDVITVKEN